MQGATQVIAVGADAEFRGRAISFFFIWCYLGTTLASLGVGFVITFFGLNRSFIGCSGAVAAFAALRLFLCYAGRRKKTSSWLVLWRCDDFADKAYNTGLEWHLVR